MDVADNERRGCGLDPSPPMLAFGLVLFLLGSMFFVDRLDWLGFDRNVPIWPWILLLLGVARVAEWRASGRQRFQPAGAWLLLLGTWGLVNEYRAFGVSYDRTWPFLVLGIGLLIVWRSQEPERHGSAKDGE